MDHITFKKKKIHFPFRVLFLRALRLPRVKICTSLAIRQAKMKKFNLLRVDEKKPALDTLNTYLAARDISQVRSQLLNPWEKASARTKRYYTCKAGQATVAILNGISPQDSQSLLNEVASSSVLRQQLISSEKASPESNVDETLMAALSECYGAASNWATR